MTPRYARCSALRASRPSLRSVVAQARLFFFNTYHQKGLLKQKMTKAGEIVLGV